MYRTDPLKCFLGDTVDKSAVIDWPQMSGPSAVAFRRFTGLRISGVLVRQGNLIFEVGDAELALCRYNYHKEF